jgi:hypothetical protein
MKARLALWVIALGLLVSPGCTLAWNAKEVLTSRVRQHLEDCAERRRNRAWAESAWEQVRAADPNESYTEDHARGFKAGFAAYLYKGGSGEPPPLPPPEYRSVRYQTPQGYRAIENWFAGYRHGAAVARESGYREWVTGPSALRSGPFPSESPPEGSEPGSGFFSGRGPELPPAPAGLPPGSNPVPGGGELLPPPRKVHALEADESRSAPTWPLTVGLSSR